jgi:hypothetical protein
MFTTSPPCSRIVHIVAARKWCARGSLGGHRTRAGPGKVSGGSSDFILFHSIHAIFYFYYLTLLMFYFVYIHLYFTLFHFTFILFYSISFYFTSIIPFHYMAPGTLNLLVVVSPRDRNLRELPVLVSVCHRNSRGLLVLVSGGRHVCSAARTPNRWGGGRGAPPPPFAGIANREVSENSAVRAGCADLAVIANIDNRAIQSCATSPPGTASPPRMLFLPT